MTLKQLNALPYGSKWHIAFQHRTEGILTVNVHEEDEKEFMVQILNTDCEPRNNEYWLKITGKMFRFQAWLGGDSCFEEMQSKKYPLSCLQLGDEIIEKPIPTITKKERATITAIVKKMEDGIVTLEEILLCESLFLKAGIKQENIVKSMKKYGILSYRHYVEIQNNMTTKEEHHLLKASLIATFWGINIALANRELRRELIVQ